MLGTVFAQGPKLRNARYQQPSQLRDLLERADRRRTWMSSANEPGFTAGVGKCTSDCETTGDARDMSRFTTRVTRSQGLRTWTTQTHVNPWPSGRDHWCGHPANHPGKPQRPEHIAKPKRSMIQREVATELTRSRSTPSASFYVETQTHKIQDFQTRQYTSGLHLTR